MLYWLCGICTLLLFVVIILTIKIIRIHKSMDEISMQFAARFNGDTNVGIDIDIFDKKMRKFANDIDKQLKILRKKHIRYTKGDNELKEALTNISHDLRTPLTAIGGYMELIERENVSDNVKKYLNIIAGRIEALTALSEELLAYSIAVSAGTYNNYVMVNLNSVLEESIAGYYEIFTKNSITPHVSITENKVDRRLDSKALSRILGNIVDNAVKYSDGDLIISLSEHGEIKVSNHTSELSEVDVERLFDRFYTIRSGTEGTGLGLSIAKALTEQMGGSIVAKKNDDIFCVTVHFDENDTKGGVK